MRRDVSFREFQERVRGIGFNPNVVTGMWNWLAEHLISYKREGYKLADCVLPLQKILDFTPSMAQGVEGIGPVRLAVYEAVYESLVRNPAPLLGHDEEVTRENLAKFAPDVHPGTITSAWHEFHRAMVSDDLSVFRDRPLLEQLERFCDHMRDRRNWSGGFKPAYDQLLRAWLEHLQSR